MCAFFLPGKNIFLTTSKKIFAIVFFISTVFGEFGGFGRETRISKR